MRQPLRTLNRGYLIKQISKLKLRDGLNHIEVMHYLESMAQPFPTLMQSYLDETNADAKTILTKTQHLVDVMLFGLIDQTTAK